MSTALFSRALFGAVSRVSFIRCASTAAAAKSAAVSATASADAASTPARPVSSCKEGAVMKGLNIFKDKPDPVAKADGEYPEWLWTLLDPAQAVSDPDAKARLRIRRANCEKIKANNYMNRKRK